MITLDSAAKLGTLAAAKIRDGQDFFINTRRARYVYRRTIGSDTADGNRRVAPASGGGLFYKDLDYSHPSWVREQTQYYLDEANSTGLASDENTGVDATHPLLTDVERVDRWGPNARLDAGRYDVWCLSDVTKMILRGTRGNGSEIWVHGSGTAYQGRTILSSGNSMTQRALCVPSTRTRMSIRGGSAGSFLTTLANRNRRLRLTSGARAGATAFAQGIQGSDVNVSQWAQLSTFVPSTFHVADICDPGGTETYVVESMGSIGTCLMDVKNADGTSTSAIPIVLDSVNLGRFDCSFSTDFPVFLGCSGVTPISPDENFSLGTFFNAMGCFCIGGLISIGLGGSFYACHNIGAWLAGPEAQLGFFYNTIAEGSALVDLTVNGGLAYFYGAASFNSVNDGLRVGPGAIANVMSTYAGPGPTVVTGPGLWGSGAAGFGARVLPGGSMNYVTGTLPNITGALGDRKVGDVPGSWSDGPANDEGRNARVYAT